MTNLTGNITWLRNELGVLGVMLWVVVHAATRLCSNS